MLLIFGCVDPADPASKPHDDPAEDTSPVDDTDDTAAPPDDTAAPAPALVVTPADGLDLGTVYVGCTLPSAFVLRNDGDPGSELVIDAASYATASSELSFDADEGTNGPLPWTLAGGESVQVSLAYAPVDEGTDTGVLTITSNDPAQPTLALGTTAAGVEYARTLDTWVQPEMSAADILFVVDDSCSMEERQAALGASFPAFAGALALAGVDYHVAVISGSDPTFRGAVLDAATPDAAAEFASQVEMGGSAGSLGQMPSEMAYQATQDGADAGPGGDFFRDEARLAIIFVADDSDASPSAWADYLSWFEYLKDQEEDLVVHAIAGDWPTGCDDADAVNNVYEMTVATGGMYLSICEADWDSQMASLADGSVSALDRFDLSSWPVPDTIVVRVDGTPVTSGWVFDETEGAIVFDAASIPAGGSTVEAEYVDAGDCD
jgi:hypothetical protein